MTRRRGRLGKKDVGLTQKFRLILPWTAVLAGLLEEHVVVPETIKVATTIRLVVHLGLSCQNRSVKEGLNQSGPEPEREKPGTFDTYESSLERRDRSERDVPVELKVGLFGHMGWKEARTSQRISLGHRMYDMHRRRYVQEKAFSRVSRSSSGSVRLV